MVKHASTAVMHLRLFANHHKKTEEEEEYHKIPWDLKYLESMLWYHFLQTASVWPDVLAISSSVCSEDYKIKQMG